MNRDGATAGPVGPVTPAVDLRTYVRQRLQAERRILLMTHLIVGYPSLEANRAMLDVMAAHDVDLVELQLPFSEPVADGPVFVRANQMALAAGLRRRDYFAFLAAAGRVLSCPRLMMGYYNTAFRQGHQAFCQRLQEAGASGFILPDLPIEEYGDLFDQGRAHRLDPILLMAPTNTSQRLRRIGERASGFVYAVARKGVTGRQTDLQDEVFGFLERCRAATDLPLALGFGLRCGADVAALAGRAEIGIVGSALLVAWEEGGETGYARLVADLAAARG